MDNDLIKSTSLKPVHFGSYAPIFEAMLRLSEQGKPIDQALLIGELYEDLPSIGGPQKIAEIEQASTNVENIKAYEKEILDNWKLKETRRVKSKEIKTLDDARRIKSKLEELTAVEDDEEYDHKQALLELHQAIENQPLGLSGFDTGFQDLNNLLDGLQPEDLIIVAARPSVGKTAFALNLSQAHALNKKIVAIFSLEMPKNQLLRRMISSIGRISGNKMRNPNARFEDDDWNKYHQALGVFSDFNYHIYDKSGQTVSYIRSKVRSLRQKYPDEDILVIIDYLQLVRPDRSMENKNIEVSEISRSLKELARDEHVPVVLLSQLSRGVEQRQDKRPMLSDLRDSGAIEQDADVVMFLYRDDYYNEETENKNIIEVIVSKQRNGPLGTIELFFEKEHSRFISLEKRYEN